MDYENPSSMVALIVGNAGEPQGNAGYNPTFEEQFPDWKAFHYAGYGFSTVKASPSSLEFTHIEAKLDGSLGSVIDQFTIHKEQDTENWFGYHSTHHEHHLLHKKKSFTLFLHQCIYTKKCISIKHDLNILRKQNAGMMVMIQHVLMIHPLCNTRNTPLCIKLIQTHPQPTLSINLRMLPEKDREYKRNKDISSALLSTALELHNTQYFL